MMPSMMEVLDLMEIEPPQRIPGHISCALHEENTPSLCIYEDGWYCYGCGVGGSPIDFVMKTQGWPFLKAIRWLESGVGDIDLDDRPTRRVKEPIDLTDKFFGEAMPWTVEAVAFVNERWPHLGYEQLRDWGICPGGRGQYLMIPHHDADGRIVGIKTRTIAGPNRGDKRAFAGSTYPLLYRVSDVCRVGSRTLVLTEGESDTWTGSRLPGWKGRHVAGLPSGVHSWRQHLDEMKAYVQIFVAVDNDDASNPVADAIIAELGRTHDVWRELPPSGVKDWTEAAVAAL